MKKKILKCTLIIVMLLVILYFVHAFITAKIYFDIYTAMNEKVNSTEDFYAKSQPPTLEPDEVSMEIFIKDNVFVKKIQRVDTETNEAVTLKLWQKYLPNKTDEEDGTGYIFIENDKDNKKQVQMLEYKELTEPENKMYRYANAISMVVGKGLSDFFETKMPEYTYSSILLAVIKHPTILYSTEFNGENCYAIRTISNLSSLFYDDYAQYVSKETKLPVGYSTNVNSGKAIYSYFTKEVTEEDIKLPNLEEYELLK